MSAFRSASGLKVKVAAVAAVLTVLLEVLEGWRRSAVNQTQHCVCLLKRCDPRLHGRRSGRRPEESCTTRDDKSDGKED